MKATQIVSGAKKIYVKAFPGLMLMTLIGLLIRLISLAPLLFLADKKLMPAALLSPVLMVLLLGPVRLNEGSILRQLVRFGRLDLTGMLSMHGYGRKLGRSIKTGLLLLLWAIPAIAATVYLVLIYNGVLMDAFTMLRTVMNLGNDSFVKAILPGLDSATVRGVAVVLLAYLLTLLPLLLGCAIHSWRRFMTDIEPKRISHRGVLVISRMIGVLTMIPFAAVAFFSARGYVMQLLTAVSNVMGGGFKLPQPDNMIYIIGAAFLVLYFPRISLSSLIPAVFVEEQNQ